MHTPSTGRRAHGAPRTTTPFDDPIAFNRRWGRLDATDVECATAIGVAYERLGGQVTGIGIVHHRRGGVGMTDTDRRWALALRAVCDAFSIEPLGVMARLRSGALVRVPLPDVLPGDYIDGLTA